MPSRPHPPAHPHGPLTEVFPDLFFVQGTTRFPGPVPVTCSRNMAVVRQGDELVLINSLRLDDAGLAALDALGRVKHVIRLAGFHGSDDPFYRERCGATVWAVKGQFYQSGFATEPDPAKVYFQADRELDETTALPLAAARLYRFGSVRPGEALLLLERDGGIVISGDALQNWVGPDPYFNWLGRWSMRAMGFFRPQNVGPGWLKQTKPSPEELLGVLDLPFEHVVPGHGELVRGRARELYRPAVTAAAEWSRTARS